MQSGMCSTYNKTEIRNKTEIFSLIQCKTYRSTGKTKNTRFSLGLLPVRKETTARTANIICFPDHEIWTKNNSIALRDYLQTSLPQMSISDMVTDEVHLNEL